jgi:hypothetical protein
MTDNNNKKIKVNLSWECLFKVKILKRFLLQCFESQDNRCGRVGEGLSAPPPPLLGRGELPLLLLFVNFCWIAHRGTSRATSPAPLHPRHATPINHSADNASCIIVLHCKKSLATFPSTAGMSLTKLSLGRCIWRPKWHNITVHKLFSTQMSGI